MKKTKKQMCYEIEKIIYPNNTYLQAKFHNELYNRKSLEYVQQLYSVIMSLNIARGE